MMTPPTSPSRQQSFLSCLLFLSCIVFVRIVLYEWRPWSSLSLKRECIIWSLSWLLYSRLYRKATRRPLSYYGQCALVQEEYLPVFQQAFQKRGLDIAVLLRDEKEKEKDDADTKKTTSHVRNQDNKESTCSSTVSLNELPSWLGKQQWNGGVGVFVVSNSTSADAAMKVEQHMKFRSSGAIITMLCENNNDKMASENKHETKTEIMYLDVPFDLQSSPGVAEASLKALGYSHRLKRYQVWKQQFKESFQILFGFATKTPSHT